MTESQVQEQIEEQQAMTDNNNNSQHHRHQHLHQNQQLHRQRTPTVSSDTHSYVMDEDDSDIGSSFDDADEDQQMEYWLQRCSICFDAPLDLCLEYCRDQYCIECFQRYVTEVVMSSWGLSVTKLKCPVCQEHIPQSEWSQFVPKAVVDHYNRFNQPYRSFTRCCPHCEKEAKPCDYTRKPEDDEVDHMQRIHDMVAALVTADCHLEHPRKQYDENDDDDDNDCLSDSDGSHVITRDYHTHSHSSLESLLPLLEGDCPQSTLLDVYRCTMKTLAAFEKYHQRFKSDSVSADDDTNNSPYYAISHEFTLLDLSPETWKQMQFCHISFFPNITCDSCHIEFCLQCGYAAHGTRTCEENMKHLIESEEDHDTVVNMKWQLNNSQRCPNCSIMINRDEGCNKVDCSLCGFCFCWACRSPWSEKCGFYHCTKTDTSNNDEHVSTLARLEEGRTELGVPDISTIQARLLTNATTLA